MLTLCPAFHHNQHPLRAQLCGIATRHSTRPPALASRGKLSSARQLASHSGLSSPHSAPVLSPNSQPPDIPRLPSPTMTFPYHRHCHPRGGHSGRAVAGHNHPPMFTTSPRSRSEEHRCGCTAPGCKCKVMTLLPICTLVGELIRVWLTLRACVRDWGTCNGRGFVNMDAY